MPGHAGVPKVFRYRYSAPGAYAWRGEREYCEPRRDNFELAWERLARLPSALSGRSNAYRQIAIHRRWREENDADPCSQRLPLENERPRTAAGRAVPEL